MHLNTVSVPFVAVSVLGFASFRCAACENGLKITVHHLENVNKNTINETETSPTIIFDEPDHSQVFRTVFEALTMILVRGSYCFSPRKIGDKDCKILNFLF